MAFAERLVTIRHNLGITQQALADRMGIHGTLIRRYEGGKVQPSLDVLRKLAVALNVSADQLLFDDQERGPQDDLRLQFEAATRLTPEERKILKFLIEGILLQHDADARTHRLAQAG